MNNLHSTTLADHLQYEDLFVGYLQLFKNRYTEKQSKQLVLTVYDQDGGTLMQLYADNVDGQAEDSRTTNIYLSRYRDINYNNTYEGHMCKGVFKNKPLLDAETLKAMTEEGINVDELEIDLDDSDDDDDDIEFNKIEDVLAITKPEDIGSIVLQIVDCNKMVIIVENTI